MTGRLLHILALCLGVFPIAVFSQVTAVTPLTVSVFAISVAGSYAAYAAAPTSPGRLDLDAGMITNVVTGMVSGYGMAFLQDQAAEE